MKSTVTISSSYASGRSRLAILECQMSDDMQRISHLDAGHPLILPVPDERMRVSIHQCGSDSNARPFQLFDAHECFVNGIGHNH
jgi:hypothetical protein